MLASLQKIKKTFTSLILSLYTSVPISDIYKPTFEYIKLNMSLILRQAGSHGSERKGAHLHTVIPHERQLYMCADLSASVSLLCLHGIGAGGRANSANPPGHQIQQRAHDTPLVCEARMTSGQ